MARLMENGKQRQILAPDNKWLAEAKRVTIALGKQAGFGWALIPNRKLETVSGIEIKLLPKK